MNISTKDLRVQPGKILEKVSRGMEIFITYRGKRVARLVPVQDKNSKKHSHDMFGMWKEHETSKSVEQEVRDKRKGRKF